MNRFSFDLDNLLTDTRDEWHDVRRFYLRTRRELDRLLQRSDRPANKIVDGARELGRELRKSLSRLG